jgi:hypothetical protein
MALTQEDLDKLKTQHGEIWHVKGTNGSWEIVFKKPARKDYKMFRANSANPARKPEAQEILLRACIVYPPLSEFDALLEKFPAIPEAEAVSDSLSEALGIASEAAEKS